MLIQDARWSKGMKCQQKLSNVAIISVPTVDIWIGYKVVMMVINAVHILVALQIQLLVISASDRVCTFPNQVQTSYKQYEAVRIQQHILCHRVKNVPPCCHETSNEVHPISLCWSFTVNDRRYWMTIIAIVLTDQMKNIPQHVPTILLRISILVLALMQGSMWLFLSLDYKMVSISLA